VLRADGFVYNNDAVFDNLRAFMVAANPSYPMDTLKPLLAAVYISQNRWLPDDIELRIIRSCWRDATDATNGNVRWVLDLIKLQMQFSPKHSGGYCTLDFYNNEKGLLCAPLRVALSVYSDMDDRDSHSDSCHEMYGSEDDDDPGMDCPCEPDVVNSLTQTFEDEVGNVDKFKAAFTDYLRRGLER